MTMVAFGSGLRLTFLAVVLALAGTAGSASAAAPGSPFGPPSDPLTSLTRLGDRTDTITLITGDRVTLTRTAPGSAPRVSIDGAPRPAGAAVGFQTTSFRDHLWVIPTDAAPLVAAGRLERRLFDVSYLVANGYSDADTRQLPVILEYADGTSSPQLGARAAALPASTATDRLESIGGAAVSVAKADAEDFWSALQRGRAATTLVGGLTKVWLDAKVQATLHESVPLVGAPTAWDVGYEGSGVEVAILDTGIDMDHPDLADRIAGARSFVSTAPTAQDDNGHGTHVASTVAGSGAASGGRYRGVAPGARLLAGKVLNDGGGGYYSDILAGMEWAVAEGARVVNMSLSGGLTDGTDVITQAVEELSASSGALFVVAAGNAGPNDETVGSPGWASAALTVAATDKRDELASFSSRGPRSVDAALKPDIAAPGVDIVAARAAGLVPGPIVDEHYAALSGTSMAAPHVAGAAAILGQRHPDWRGPQLKAALTSTAEDVGSSVYGVGAGRLDVARAVRQQVVASTPSLDYGLVTTNREHAPIAKEVHYTNLSERAVTLALRPSLRKIGGAPVPAGTLTVEDTVTVPAGGTAAARVTLAPNLPAGRYSGALVASDEATGTRVTTPIALVREPHRVDMTVRIRGPEGELVDGLPDVLRVDGQGGLRPGRMTGPGESRYRVAPGAYSVSTVVAWVDDDNRYRFAWLIEGEVTVTGRSDVVVELDARRAREITFKTPEPAETHRQLNLFAYQRTVEGGDRYAAVVSEQAAVATWRRLMVTPTPRVTRGKLRFWSQWMLGRAQVHMRVRGHGARELHPVVPVRYTRADGSEWQEAAYADFVPFRGTRDLPMVDVGRGEPADLAGRDLGGKLALMETEVCYLYLARAQRLRDAGAAGIVVFPTNPECGLPFNILRDETLEPRIGIANVLISRREGLALRADLARRPVTIRVEGTLETPYSYMLKPYEEGRIPTSLDYRIGRDELARTDVEVHSDEPSGFNEFHHLYKPDDPLTVVQDSALALAYGLVAYTDRRDRREYVGPVEADLVDLRGAYASGPLGDPAATTHTTRSTIVRLDRAPRRLRWFVTPLTPGPAAVQDSVRQLLERAEEPVVGLNKYCAFCREGNWLVPMFYMVGGGGQDLQDDDFTRWVDDGFAARLFKDGEEIPQTPVFPGLIPGFELPAGRARYRLIAESRDTTAEWRFTSSQVTAESNVAGYGCFAQQLHLRTDPCRPEPVPFVRYDLGSSLRADNTVRARGPHQFDVAVSHSPSRAAMPPIGGLELSFSTDGGAHWRPVRLKRVGGGRYVARADYGRLRDGTVVSLRARAWNMAGNSIELTTKRAFTLVR